MAIFPRGRRPFLAENVHLRRLREYLDPVEAPLDPEIRAEAAAILRDAKRWAAMYGRLLNFARKRTGTIEKGSHLVSDAYSEVLDGVEKGTGRQWNPRQVPDLAAYLIGVMRSLSSHEEDSKRAELEETGTEAVEEAPSHDAVNAEALNVEKQRYERGLRRIATARSALEAKADTAGLAAFRRLIALDRNVDALVVETGLSRPQVYIAIRRAKRALEDALEQHPDSSGPMPVVPPVQATDESEEA
jgi:hypothetical protein